MILIIYAHPYPQHSHANKRMLEQAGTLEGVEIRSLYQLYPDFNIDVGSPVPIWLSGSTRCSGIACRRC